MCNSPSVDKCDGGKKRHLEDVSGSDTTLSRNKLKKLRRNASKSFVPKADKFVKCGTCGNPKVRVLFSAYSVSQKNLPCGFLTFFFPKGWEFFNQLLHTYYTFLSTLDSKFLFSYLQL